MYRAFLLVNGRLSAVSGKFTWKLKEFLLSFADGHVEAVADSPHAAAEVTAEFADCFFSVPLGDVCLLFVGFDADVYVLSAEVCLYGFCYLVAKLGG
jgi:hypothetical protein